MEKKFLQREWIILLMLLIPFIYIAFIWNQLPGKIPTHFNLEGKSDAYGSKAFGTLLMPSINIALYFLLLFIPRIDPRYKNYSLFQSSYYSIRLIIHIFFTIIAIVILQASLTGFEFISKLIPSFTFLLIAFLGNYMRTVRPNFFVGIRTPWTLSNDEVWRKTHEIGGKLFFFTGIIAAILLWLIPVQYSLWIVFPCLLFIVLVPVIYSYSEYKKIQRKT